MTTTRLLTVLLLIFTLTRIYGQSVSIDGNVFIKIENAHEGIQIVFERLAPSPSFDTVYTDNNGYYTIILEAGVYGITYSKNNYITLYNEQSFYSNVTLPDTTLEIIGLSGQLSDTLYTGTYKVSGNIEVADNDTLYIEPGVELMFMQDLAFSINGLLIANGTITDSIKFSVYNGATSWNGIDFQNTSDDNSILSYGLIEKSSSSGIFIDECSPQLNNLMIRECSRGSYFNGLASSCGGGICLRYSKTIITNSVISDNYTSNAGSGGGIYSYKGSPQILNCLITANNPDAIIFYATDSFIISNSTIVANVNRGISGSATQSSSITNCIVANNSGEGICDDDNISIYNCNVWNNNEGNFVDADNWLGVNVTTNAQGDSVDAYGNMQTNPLFINAIDNDYRLSSSSPCINAGNTDTIGLGIPEFDLLGNKRIYDSIIDIGACEFQRTTGIWSSQLNSDYSRIFPNPADNFINIRFPETNRNNASILLFDINGELLLTKKTNATNSTLIDVSDFSQGIYFIQIISKEINTMDKIIVN